ncbi:MAG: hypothetical protein AB7T49_12870 [Oligoflexales bacterium]
MKNAARSLSPLFLVLLLWGCVSNPERARSGIQEGYAGFVPARIAVFDCMPWPSVAAFKDLPLSNLNAEQMQQFCKALNDYVIAGFEDQPFMHGISPKVVDELLAAKSGVSFSTQIEKAWARSSDACDKCETPVDYYRQSILKRPNWTLLLSDLSDTLAHADAVLLPMIAYAKTNHYVDRGLDVSEIRAGIVLMLINTSNGELIWASQRDALADKKRLVSDQTQGKEEPSLDVLLSRLLTDEMWREFPGKQFLK